MDKNDEFYTAAAPATNEPEKTNVKEEDKMETRKTNPLLVILVIVIAILIIWIGYTLVKQQNDQIAWEKKTVAQQRDELTIRMNVLESTSKTEAVVALPASDYVTADTSGIVTEQAYVPHPRFYQETGIEGSKTWNNLVVNNDEYLVVGGVSVNGINDGVYRGYGPGKYTVTVTNGFVAIVDDDWGNEEFDFRVGQAVQYEWAHAHIDRGPIPVK